jgi:hypothetical protein
MIDLPRLCIFSGGRPAVAVADTGDIMAKPIFAAVFTALVSASALGVACSASSDRAGRDAPGGGASSGGNVGTGATGGGVSIDVDSGAGGGGSGCPTTVSGTVYDPAGTLPLYNVVVYVPSEPVEPIVSGAACETCDGNFSGRPIAAAVSDVAGKFTMDIANVPARTEIPLVVQAGKWRRQVTIPAATDCADTPLDGELTRLPRSKQEGNLPKIAVMRGGSDALECIFTKIGVDLAEFSSDAGEGSIHLYYSNLVNATAETGQMSAASGAVPLAPAETLFGDLTKMKTYDMILLNCEGGDDRYNPPNLTHRENVHRYFNEGGRLFGGHYHNGIIDNRELPDGYPPFPSVVQFSPGRSDITPKLFTATVNTGFEKGRALADWLFNVGASPMAGSIAINDSERTVIDTLDPTAVSWINTTFSGQNAALYYGFPTPVGGAACGRAVFTDVHLASGSGDSGKAVFPSCATELSPQQKALAFLIFDLANCVTTTETEPPPPPVVY